VIAIKIVFLFQIELFIYLYFFYFIDILHFFLSESVDAFINNKIGKLFGMSFAYEKCFKRLHISINYATDLEIHASGFSSFSDETILLPLTHCLIIIFLKIK